MSKEDETEISVKYRVLADDIEFFLKAALVNDKTNVILKSKVEQEYPMVSDSEFATKAYSFSNCMNESLMFGSVALSNNKFIMRFCQPYEEVHDANLLLKCMLHWHLKYFPIVFKGWSKLVEGVEDPSAIEQQTIKNILDSH